MAQTVNGVLYVEYFTPTGNPGEYTFENGVFNNQNDLTGNGALDIDTNFVVFTPVSDSNTFMPMAGAVNRFKFTALTYIDTVRISGTILYDEDQPEIGAPTSGSFCLVSKVTANKRLAVPPLDDIYNDLVKGGTIAAMLNDLINILDKSSGGSTANQNPPTVLPVVADGQTEFTLPFNPVNKEYCLLSVNGLLYTYGSGHDYVIDGGTLRWLNNTVLEVNDNVVIR